MQVQSLARTQIFSLFMYMYTCAICLTYESHSSSATSLSETRAIHIIGKYNTLMYTISYTPKKFQLP